MTSHSIHSIKTKPIENQEFWLHHLNQWQESNLSRAAYCRQHQLNYERFQYWFKKQSKNTQPKLIAVTSKEPIQTIPEETFCRLILNNGNRLDINSQVAFSQLLNKVLS